MDINIGPEINIFLFLQGEICFFALKGRFQILGVPDKGVLLPSLIGTFTLQHKVKLLGLGACWSKARTPPHIYVAGLLDITARAH